MIRYFIKNVDGTPVDNTRATRLNQAHTEILTKIEIDLKNLNSLKKIELITISNAMAVSFSTSETKTSLITKINEKVMTREEIINYIRENTEIWNGPTPVLNP